jgi:hypothetical protein
LSTHPYKDLPQSAYWRSAVADRHFSRITPLWSPKFDIRPEHLVVTFGSCFAQHIGKALVERGYAWLDTEPPPPGMNEAKRFNYTVFSSRTANIYTTSLLLQWTRWALLGEPVPLEVWEQGGRYFDPFRPAIEPNGFASVEEMLRLREVTIHAFGNAIRSADVLIFTLGLTESWWNRTHGYEYQLCPGTAAGVFDPEHHAFRNLDFYQVAESLEAVIGIMQRVNGRLKIILTVSPVPLVATNSGHHVMVATIESKSILRAVAGQIARKWNHVDYFPSYELISSPVMGGVFFEQDRRQVSPMGVNFVMNHFFSCLHGMFGAPVPQGKPPPASTTATERATRTQDDIVCEEELLAAFTVKPFSPSAQ